MQHMKLKIDTLLCMLHFPQLYENLDISSSILFKE